MLKLILGDKVVDLLDNELSIVQTSPYPLVSIGSGGNFIFNFNLPATDDLKQIFKYSHRPQAKSPFAEVPYRLDLGSGMVYEGTACLKEISRMEYEVFCTVGNGDFNVASKKVKLSELDLGGDRLIDFHQIYTIASINPSIRRSHFDIEMFSETIIPKFSDVEIDTGPSLNNEESALIINSFSAISLVFNFVAEIKKGMVTFHVFKDNQLYDNFEILGNQQNSYVLPATNGQVITWDLVLDSQETNDQGTYALDVTIDISMNVKTNGAPFDPSKRYPEADYAVFPLFNPEVFSSWDDDFYAIDNVSIKTLYNQFFTVINYFANNVFPLTLSGISEGEEFTAGNIITPFPYIAYLIKRIAFHFNYKIESNPFENELKHCTLINHFCENKFLNKSSKIITLKEGFNLVNHVPDWTVYDFLKHLCNLFAMGYEIDAQKHVLTFTFLDDIMNSEDYIDISDLVIEDLRVDNELSVSGVKIIQKLPSGDKAFEKVKSLDGLNFKGTVYLILPNEAEINDCYFVTKLNGFYAFKYDPETYQFGWILHSRNFTSEMTIGDEPKEISSELCPVILNSPNLIDTVLGHPDDRLWLIPESQQASRFEGAPEMFQNKWSPLIAFYHGLFPDSKGVNYPFASLDIVDIDGELIPGLDLSLRLDGVNGLYEKKWKKYVEWRIKARTGKVKIIPNRKFLQNLRFSKKLMINGVKYLLVEHRGNIDKSGPKISELTLLVL